MADHSDMETLPFDFQSPSSSFPCGSKLKDVNEDDYKHFQNTVPFDDTMVLDSPLAKTQLEKLDFDTEVVDDPDCVEDVRIQPICEYEKEVVLDSEDERMHKTKAVGVANGFSVDRTYRRVKRNALDLHKRQFSPPFEQMEDLAADSDASAAEKCGAEIKGCSISNIKTINGEKALPQLQTCEQDFARLNYVDSQEPGESSQANALDFVNHFLSSSNVDLSPGINPRKTVREKSPPVSSAKGPQSLAKIIKIRDPIAKTGTFDWANSDQQEGGNFCNKRTKASFDFEGFRHRAVRHQKARHLDSKGGSSTANECEEKKDVINLQKNITELTHSHSRFVEHSPIELCKMEQVSVMKLENNSVRELDEHLHAESSGQQLEAIAFERDALDMFDVGINTQIAAEAMEALFNGPPPGCSARDSYPGPQNTLKDSPRGVTNTKAHMEQAFIQKSACSDSGGIARKTKRRKRSARQCGIRTSSSSWKHSELAITAKAKGGKVSDGQLNCRNLACANESSGISVNPIEQRKAEGAVGMNNIEECKNYMSSTALVKHISVANGQSKGECVAHRSKQWMTGGRLKGTKDQSDNIGERVNDVTEGGILTYKRKRRHLVANPYEVLSAKEKCFKLCFNASEEAKNSKWEQQELTDLHVAAITSGLKSNTWSYPRGKRSHRKVQSHSNGGRNLSAPLATGDGKESITHFTIIRERSEGKNVELCGSECTTAVNCTEGINVPSSKNMPEEYHRKPCNKNLPKSYLLKELIKLGVPESISDFAWKDSRRRRDMAYVRVLFSQHLDDDIIRQQKKILARLGIFIASCAMDATHFIADRFVRTRNMLEAIALGKPVVTPLWLESCGQARCLIDERNYILRDAKKEKEIGFSMPVSLARASEHPLLKGQRIFITPNIKPDKELISSLVKIVHGKAVEQNQIPVERDQNILDDLLILSCEEDKAICVPFLNKGAAVYSSELLLNGIVIQKLEYERHQLFVNHVKRNRPNRRSRRDAALSLFVNKCD